MEQKDVESRLESLGIRYRMSNREYEEEFLRAKRDCEHRLDKHFCKKVYTCSLLTCPFAKVK